MGHRRQLGRGQLLLQHNIADLSFQPGYYSVYVSYAQWNGYDFDYSGEYIDTYEQYYTATDHETSDYCYLGNDPEPRTEEMPTAPDESGAAGVSRHPPGSLEKGRAAISIGLPLFRQGDPSQRVFPLQPCHAVELQDRQRAHRSTGYAGFDREIVDRAGIQTGKAS